MALSKITQEPGAPHTDKAAKVSLGRYVWLLAAAWTVVVIISLFGNLYQQHQATLEIAQAEARSRIEQIILYRQWNAIHGGVYVPADKQTPPNPYLSTVPERDLLTPSGRKLTLINPAYMTRQVFELGQQQNKMEGRLISLKPLRPGNAPDLWEAKALKKLKEGAPEYSSVEHLPDQNYLRFVQPVFAETDCLACHASQGYKEGDFRGGISVLIPLAPLQAASKQHQLIIWLSHGLLWLLGLGGIVLGATRLDKSLAQQRRIEMDLEEANQSLGALIKAASLAIVALDAHGSVRLWNPAAEAIFGWKASEVVGRPPPFLPENPSKEFQERYSRGLQGEPVSGDGECRHRNGMIMDFSFSMSPLYSPEDELTGVITVLEDITERLQMEEELFKANEKLKVWVYEFARRNRDITLLNAMGDLLQACQTLEEAYAGVGQYVPRIFPDVSGALFLFKEGKNALEAVAKWGKSQIGAEIFSPDECWALRMGQEHLVQDHGSGLVCGHLAGVSQGYLCIPMTAHGENVGLFLLLKNPQETPQEETLSDSQKRLATTAAKQIALSLSNLHLRNSLLEQAIHDPLTGLFNRRYMEETLEREIFRVHRKDAPLGIIMLDLDYFKHFNDSFGHEAGDTLLQAMGNFLRSHIRREDISCRYGGEEFILIMPETSLEITRERAEKLRQGVQDLQVAYRGQHLGPITVSLGVAAFPDHGPDGEELIRAADAAMYRAKEEGRNRVVTAAEEGTDQTQ